MNSHASRILALVSTVVITCASARAGLTINPNFTSGDTTDFPGSKPISQAGNASTVSTIEASIDAAIAQITTLVANPLTFKVKFVDDPDTSLGASVNTGNYDISYTSLVSYLKAQNSQSTYDKAALATRPAGPGTGINGNSTQISLGGANLDAIGDTTLGNSLISQNGGFAGTIALNLGSMNLSRKTNNPNDYDLESVVMHEMDEILGIGGQGSTIGNGASDVGILDLFRYSKAGVRSYSTSGNVASYFSVNGGKTNYVYFNQSKDGDYGDWGDGVIPADDSNNTPPQVQDAFGDPGTQTNMGRNEAIALDVSGWTLTTDGTNLEEGKSGATPSIATRAAPFSTANIVVQAVPEPGEWASLLLGGLALAGVLRRRMMS